MRKKTAVESLNINPVAYIWSQYDLKSLLLFHPSSKASFVGHKEKRQKIPRRPGTVTNECKFKCQYCGQVFTSWQSSMKHYYTYHKSMGSLSSAEESVIEKKLHKCTECGKELLKDNYIVYRHIKRGHTNKVRNRGEHLVENECKFR